MRLVDGVGLVRAPSERLRISKAARPYQNSDHVLDIAFNLLRGGAVLEDIESRRDDAAFVAALGARTIPDPTTAGDYLRWFDADEVWQLTWTINDVRADVSKRSGVARGTARTDAVGALVPPRGPSVVGWYGDVRWVLIREPRALAGPCAPRARTDPDRTPVAARELVPMSHIEPFSLVVCERMVA